ncbi:MAG TPA: hypothetical protein PK028_00765 [Bacteroidales bacterium]|jgi:hypothetical protein|nr:hypothetical protein [Bacteroidales bacterium]MDI9573693.1 hypothetical protein [Bacteroidota bacterium]OQC62059.1 MAG: hypothetical protein BWX51_00206 [Bacteroidetes bacterium ADurb.Bin012]HNV16155.1 hypothetical protein [Bacteroidales bacterium]HOC14892.1 hypothetical protein [Bacteroidales bacterium]
MKKIFLLLFIICYCMNPLFSQHYSKGTVLGEFYYVTTFITYNFGWEYGLIYSNDYGQFISY